MEDLKADPDSHSTFTLENGRLHHKGRLVLSAKSACIPKIQARFHTTTTEGHSGVYRTNRRMARWLY